MFLQLLRHFFWTWDKDIPWIFAWQVQRCIFLLGKYRYKDTYIFSLGKYKNAYFRLASTKMHIFAWQVQRCISVFSLGKYKDAYFRLASTKMHIFAIFSLVLLSPTQTKLVIKNFPPFSFFKDNQYRYLPNS